MTHFRITLAYDGTDYVGWQRQANGVSIQGLIEDALSELDGRAVAVAAAGRTDAGVHALGQVAGFSLQRAIAADAVPRALNARLPPAIRVVDAAETDERFHARFSAHEKRYHYRIWNAPVANPFEHRYAWHIHESLDVAAMNVAARMLEGRHEFAAFAASGTAVKTTTRQLSLSRISEGGMRIGLSIPDFGFPLMNAPESTINNPKSKIESAIRNPHSAMLVYTVVGDGFLRHMVRAIVGTLVEIGRGRRPPEWIGQVMASADRGAAGPTAPPQGLFLVSVSY
jgi:tRNA pseudouridine38-40 synthase